MHEGEGLREVGVSGLKMAPRDVMALVFIRLLFSISLIVIIAESHPLDESIEDCNQTTKRTLSVFKSLRFPDAYSPGLDCQYTVHRRSKLVCSVTFLFNVLDLFHSDGCEVDYLVFDDTGEKICGSKPVGYSRTMSFEPLGNKSRNEVNMRFHSSNVTTAGLGYMITVVQQECPRKTCDAVYDSDDDFVLTSPNYPMPYDNSRTCTFTIRRSSPAVCKLHLVVRKFELEQNDKCEADYLRLADGRRLCGVIQAGQIVEVNFQNDTMVLEFQSDHFTTANGFQLEARQVECLASTTTSKTNNDEKKTLVMTTQSTSFVESTETHNNNITTKIKMSTDVTTLLPSSSPSSQSSTVVIEH